MQTRYVIQSEFSRILAHCDQDEAEQIAAELAKLGHERITVWEEHRKCVWDSTES